MTRRLRVFLPVLAVFLLADQATKAWARGALAHGPMPVLDGNVYFQLGLNPGIAFSLFTNADARIVLAIAGLAVAIGIAIWVARSAGAGAVALVGLVGLAMIASGAAGNAIDRVHMGPVTDFVVIQIGSHRWPTFNVADSALLIGVVLMLVGGRKARTG
jgi:signal peptidase II